MRPTEVADGGTDTRPPLGAPRRARAAARPEALHRLTAGLPHLSADVLAQRLRELEEAGIVRRRTLPPPAGSRVYELTERGEALEPVVLALGRWGSVAPFPPREVGIGVDGFVIALRTLFDPGAADDLAASYELRLGEQPFHAEIAGGRFAVARGTADRPDATIAAEPGPLAVVLWHDRDLGEAVRAGDVAVEGSEAAVPRFLTLFPLPEDARPSPRRAAAPRAP